MYQVCSANKIGHSQHKVHHTQKVTDRNTRQREKQAPHCLTSFKRNDGCTKL